MNKPTHWLASAAQRAALACLASCIVGCGQQSSVQTSRSPTSLPNPAIETTVVDRTAYDAVVADQRGKVVLVDFWATWCGPCLAQLPHSIALAKEYGDKLTVITVSMDDPTDAVQVHNRLLERGAAKLVNLISEATGPRGVEEFEIDGGALPHYKLYDRKGKLRQTFAVDPAAEKQFTPDDVAAAVAKLVDE